jgi:hypothetical protein
MELRCTDCNQPIKPVVAVDIDGTLGKYHDHFLDFAEGWFGHPFSHDYKGYEELSDFMQVTRVDYRACKLAYRQGGMKRTMPPYDHAARLVEALREEGAEVWLTTTRPYMRLDNVDPDTREWCSRMGITYDGLIYDDDKYSRLADIVGPQRVVGVLEDLPNLYNRAVELGLNPLLIRRLHNSYLGTGHKEEVFDLEQAHMKLAERVRGWYASAKH